MDRITRRHLKAGLITGLAVIAAWYVAAHTTLILAYRAGTLSQTQSLCDGPLGRFARAMSTAGAANCNQVDSLSMWVNAAGFAGALLLLASGAVLLYRAQHQPGAPAETETPR